MDKLNACINHSSSLLLEITALVELASLLGSTYDQRRLCNFLAAHASGVRIHALYSYTHLECVSSLDKASTLNHKRKKIRLSILFLEASNIKRT